jgi:hypothetical protein
MKLYKHEPKSLIRVALTKKEHQPIVFKCGAEWQSERMYSEEDLREAYNVARHIGKNNVAYEFDEWFEKFKKK